MTNYFDIRVSPRNKDEWELIIELENLYAEVIITDKEKSNIEELLNNDN